MSKKAREKDKGIAALVPCNTVSGVVLMGHRYGRYGLNDVISIGIYPVHK